MRNAGYAGRRIAAALSALVFLAGSPSAAEIEGAPPTMPEAVLPPVTVLGTFSNPATGKSTLSGEILRDLPAGNGTINELLVLFPDVQLAEEARSASGAGEILPPEISISGGKSFQNDFRIDGFGNNSYLDPAGRREVTVADDVPGHPQEIFLQKRLVEHLTVFDSNVPARYGGFTGGVVLAETRDPGSVLGGTLHYRTSRAGWTDLHGAGSEKSAPDFEKDEAGFELDLPLGEDGGLLGGYERLSSSFPVSHLGGSKEQERRLENFFLKGKQLFPEGELELTFLSSPYRSENFLRHVRGSDFTIRGGGWQIGGEYVHFLDPGELQLRAIYGRSENSRNAPRFLRQWATVGDHAWGRSVDSDASYEGGFGPLEKEQQNLSLGSSFIGESVTTGPVAHRLEAGIDLEHVTGRFSRPEEAHVYLGADVVSSIICGEDILACGEGEQFFTSRTIYPAAEAKAELTQVDLYAEDSLTYRRLTLRPGVRLSWDDLSGDLNTAPRLAAGLDLFGNGGTVLIGGLNRYFARPLITFRLREAQSPPTVQYRSADANLLQPWVPSPFPGATVTRFSGLKIPYSDEAMVGVDQGLLGGRLSLKYVLRKGRDEYARELGPLQPDNLRYYTLTNKGRSRHESVRLAWERSWRRHFVSLAANWQETDGTNESYDELLDDEQVSSRVWFDDRIIYRSELPRSDFNRAWTATLTSRSLLPWGFSFANIARYRSGYRRVESTGEGRVLPDAERRTNPLTGEDVFESVPVYREVALDDSIVFDWILAWHSPGDRPLRLTLEVYNVFNEKVETGVNEVEVGRQFWVGVEMGF